MMNPIPAQTIVLVRHGEVEANPEHRFVGQRDVALSARGEARFERLGACLAKLFADNPPKTIFCSDLRRSIACADRLRRAFRPAAGTMPVVADQGFREISLGAWEGLSKAEVEQRWPGALEERIRDLVNYSPAGGESFALLQRRALMAIVRARLHTPQGLLLVVGHQAFNRCVLADYLALPLADAVRIAQPYGAVSLLEGR